jgi:hypothetical protein
MTIHDAIRIFNEQQRQALSRIGDVAAAVAGYPAGPPAAPDPPGKPPPGKRPRPRKPGRGTANQRIRDELDRNPESSGWSQRRWADFLNCSPSAVAKTSAWGTIMTTRALIEGGRLPPELAKRRGRSGK